jgi:hypothetical protein
MTKLGLTFLITFTLTCAQALESDEIKQCVGKSKEQKVSSKQHLDYFKNVIQERDVLKEKLRKTKKKLKETTEKKDILCFENFIKKNEIEDRIRMSRLLGAELDKTKLDLEKTLIADTEKAREIREKEMMAKIIWKELTKTNEENQKLKKEKELLLDVIKIMAQKNEK